MCEVCNAQNKYIVTGYKDEHIEELFDYPMTRKEFLTLPPYLRNKILKRKASEVVK